MVYSVWDPVKHVYTYYNGPALPYGEVPAPKHISPEPLGVAPDGAAWPLPRNVVKIGEGREARGMIASAGTEPVGTLGWLVVVGLLVAGYSLNKALR